MDEKGLGRRLQMARQAAGMTQQMLCQKAGLSYSTLTKIERGAIKSPSIFTIQSIGNALGVSLDELIGTPARVPVMPKVRKRSKSGVKFVYFDINGCLVRAFHRSLVRLAHESGQPADIVESVFWHNNDQVCRGDMSLSDFNAILARELQLPSVNFYDYYLSDVEPIPEMHELVTWVSELYGIGLLTNIMPGLVSMMREQGLLPNVAYDAIVDSSEVHTIKPEEAIYKIAQEKTQQEPQEILFIDDTRANLMAAEKLGWRVLWFDNYHAEESAERIKQALQPSGEGQMNVTADETGLGVEGSGFSVDQVAPTSVW